MQPHYDDNDIGAGGTIAALQRAGAEVHYVTVADDLLGVLDPELTPEEAGARLRAEQEEAGRRIGVASQRRLDYPDAGAWPELELRDRLLCEIRRVRPDFLLTVDPWLPTEAHRDHTRTGVAALEAVLLCDLPRARSADAEVDAAYFDATRGGAEGLRGVALYFTARPNTFVDIGAGLEAKHAAIDAYASQLDADTLRAMHAGLEALERRHGPRAAAERAEALRVLHPAHLHCNPDAEEMERGDGG